VASDIFFNGTENSANTWEIITSGGGVERQNIIWMRGWCQREHAWVPICERYYMVWCFTYMNKKHLLHYVSPF